MRADTTIAPSAPFCWHRPALKTRTAFSPRSTRGAKIWSRLLGTCWAERCCCISSVGAKTPVARRVILPNAATAARSSCSIPPISRRTCPQGPSRKSPGTLRTKRYGKQIASSWIPPIFPPGFSQSKVWKSFPKSSLAVKDSKVEQPRPSCTTKHNSPGRKRHVCYILPGLFLRSVSL